MTWITSCCASLKQGNQLTCDILRHYFGPSPGRHFLPQQFRNILWDLDGTLTDPKIGIITCIQYALKKWHHPPPEMEELHWCIGPPLSESFGKLCPAASHEQIELLIHFYRERFGTTGMFENQVYPFTLELLKQSTLCYKNYLATSKPHFYASQILRHFQIDSHFNAIHGSELNGVRTNKAELIDYILKSHDLDPAETIMIGDRKHDVFGAKKCKVFSVGITWGYGSVEELQTAHADRIFSSAEQLIDFLKSY